jgi:hypothetical protein
MIARRRRRKMQLLMLRGHAVARNHLYVIPTVQRNSKESLSLFGDERFAEIFEDLEKVADRRSHSVASSKREEELKKSETGLRRAR